MSIFFVFFLLFFLSLYWGPNYQYTVEELEINARQSIVISMLTIVAEVKLVTFR